MTRVHHQQEWDRTDKISLQFGKFGFLDVTNTKKKTVAAHITYLMCSLLLLVKIYLQLVTSHIASAFHICLSSLRFYICSLTETMLRKFQGSSESSFGSSGEDNSLFKISKW